MPASYPSSAKVFTTKSDGPGNTILAAHINDLQLEVTAVEQDLIAGLPATRGGTGNTSAGSAGQVLTSTGSAFTPQTAPAQQLSACGRLTLTTATPITTADVTAATTLYYALYVGNRIALYTGTAWLDFAIAELSIAVPATTDQMYDVFVDYNSGTPALALTAWTNDTTRATALTTQDGVYVLTGSTGKRYVGSFRTTGVSGQTEDSFAKRFVWNYYHRAARAMRVLEGTNSWNYSTAAFHQANASTANQLAIVVGVSEDAIEASVQGAVSNSAGSAAAAVAIGLDATNASATGCLMGRTNAVGAAGSIVPSSASLRTVPAIGYHFLAWLEYDATGAGTTTWYGDNGSVNLQAGIHGMWRA